MSGLEGGGSFNKEAFKNGPELMKKAPDNLREFMQQSSDHRKSLVAEMSAQNPEIAKVPYPFTDIEKLLPDSANESLPGALDTAINDVIDNNDPLEMLANRTDTREIRGRRESTESSSSVIDLALKPGDSYPTPSLRMLQADQADLNKLVPFTGKDTMREYVKSIQKKVGVRADGVYGPQTRAAVKRALSK